MYKNRQQRKNLPVTFNNYTSLYDDYDNTSNYGKKNEVVESCPEFNAEQHFIIPFFR